MMYDGRGQNGYIMKNNSVQARQVSTVACQPHPHPIQNDFIDELKHAYLKLSARQAIPTFQSCLIHQSNKKERPKRTRSKSAHKRKSQSSVSPRKSTRIAHAQEVLLEIDKEPKWNVNRLRRQNLVPKISQTPVLKIAAKPLAQAVVSSNHPLYEFLSGSPQKQDLSPIVKPEYSRKASRKTFDACNDDICDISPNIQNDQNHTNIRHQLQMQQVLDWVPDKSNAQLLRIQTTIDEYFLFKACFRPNRVVELEQLIKYIRDIQGFYFNRARFQKLLAYNPSLYKLIKVDDTFMVKCGVLKPEDQQERTRKTKMAMMEQQQARRE